MVYRYWCFFFNEKYVFWTVIFNAIWRKYVEKFRFFTLSDDAHWLHSFRKVTNSLISYLILNFFFKRYLKVENRNPNYFSHDFIYNVNSLKKSQQLISCIAIKKGKRWFIFYEVIMNPAPYQAKYTLCLYIQTCVRATRQLKFSSYFFNRMRLSIMFHWTTCSICDFFFHIL